MTSRALSVTSAGVLNATASNVQLSQATIAGAGSLLPIVVGMHPVGGKIVALKIHQSYLYAIVAWCAGESDSVVSVTINDLAPPSGVTVVHYTGSAAQAVDSQFQVAEPAYADAMPGVCYSSFRISKRATITGFPRFSAVIRGLKVAQTSGGTPAWSDNPAYVLAALVERSDIGMGKSIDWSSVASSAAFCDQLVGGERRHVLNLVIDVKQPVTAWIDSVRDYAGAFVVPEGAGYRIVNDGPSASVKSFGPTNIVAGSMRLDERGIGDKPTIVEVSYTDTSSIPPREVSYNTGYATPRRLARIARPGITRHSEAVRWATERLNEANLCGLTARFQAFDDALQAQVGDVIDITHPLGLSAKLMRLTRLEATSPGRWSVECVEYDPAKYSSTVVAAPTYPDTSVLGPSSPPSVTFSYASEETYQTETGVFASRVRVIWSVPPYPFLLEYIVTVRDGATVIQQSKVPSDATSYAAGPLQEGKTFSLTVTTVSSSGATADAATAVTILGKSAIPGNVATLSGLEAGGRVFLSWSPADNPTSPGTPDPDVWRYEVRYGSTGGSWETASLLDQVDALTFVAETIPPGTWRFYVKAIDSIKQYSASAATRDITVTLDSGAYTAQAHTFVSATLTNMAAWTARPDATQYWTTNFGDGVGYGHSDTNNATGTFTDLASTVWPQPHTAGNSAWESESWDTGSSLSGTWTATLNYTLHSGTATVSIMLSADGSTWVTYPGTSAKATGRFVKLRIDITTGSATVAGYPSVTLSQTPRSESVASVTTLSSGGKLVQLANAYSVARTLQLTPIGSTFATAVADRLLVAPVAGLQLVQTMTGGGNCYVYQTIATNARVMASGDFLEYDVWVDPANPNNLAGGFGIYSTTSNWTHTYTFTDQNGIAMLNGDLTGRAGQWYARKAAIPAAFIGQTAANWDLINEADTAGYYRTVYRNIRITDGAGTTRLTIWASGEPAVNSIHIANLQTNNACGPSNSFMAYAFNSGGTQISRDVSVKFEGS